MKIKSRVLSLALVLAMVMSAFSPALAKTGKQQDVKKKEIEKHALKAANAQKKGNTKKRNVFEEGDFKSSGAILTGFSDSGLEKFNTQSDKTVNLPETMGGVKITTIGNHAFSGLKISGLNIPEGYERINVRAFYKSDLKKIQVPKELKKIDKIAFEDSIAKVEVYTEDQACFDALKALIKEYDDEDEEANEEPSCSWTVKLGQSNNNTVNLTFKANNGTNEIKTVKVEKDKEYILPECDFAAPAGKEFKSWDLGHGMFKKPGEKFTPKTDKEITAIWAKISGIENFTLDKTEINTMANEKLTAKFKVKDMATLSGHFDLVLRVQSYTTIQPGLKIKVKRTIGSDVKENTFTTVDKLTTSSLLCLAKAVGDDKLLSFEQNKGKEIEHEISFEGIPEDKTYKLKLQVCSFDNENFTSSVASAHYETDAIDFTAKSSIPEGKVSVNFDANGGTGSMQSEIIDKDSEYELPNCEFEPPAEKVFDKWSVSIGGSAPEGKNPGDKITTSGNVTVKAEWKDKPAPPTPKHKVTFDADGGEGEMPEAEVEENDDYILPACAFGATEGKEFDKWSVTVGVASPIDKMPGDPVKVTGNVTVKAVWKNKPIPSVDVIFDANGGSGEMPKETVTKNSKYTLPSCEFTAPSGSEFLKWEVKVGAAAPVFKMPGDRIAASDSISVKAVWSKKITAKFNSGDEEINGKLPENIVVTGSEEIFLPLPTFAAVDETKEFVAWEDEEHNQYLPGAAFMLDENTEFTAVWEVKVPPIQTKTVKYNYNEGTEERSYEVGTVLSLPKYDADKHPMPQGMKFAGWKVEVAGEQAKILEVGDSFELKDDTVITPEYAKIPPKPLTKLKIKAPKTFKIKKKAKKAVLTLNIKGAKQVDLKKLNAELRMGKKLIKKMDLKSIGKKGAYKIKLTAKDIKKLKKGKLSFIVIGNNSIAGIKVTINFAFK